MKCTDVAVVNKLGMHARASAKLVSLASSFESAITVTRDGRTVNGKSIMGIMMLAAARGTTIFVSAEGDDEDKAMEGMERLFRNKFGEKE